MTFQIYTGLWVAVSYKELLLKELEGGQAKLHLNHALWLFRHIHRFMGGYISQPLNSKPIFKIDSCL